MFNPDNSLWISADNLEELRFRIQREIDYPNPQHAESIQILLHKLIEDAKVRYA